MSIAGYPMDHGDQGRQDDGRATPSGGAPGDWDKQFTEIVSGLSGDMRWEVTTDEMEAPVAQVTRAPNSIWTQALPDTAEDRRARRELRRAERAEALAAFRQAQEELAAAHEADTEHFVAPEPPPIGRLKRRTVAALTMIVLGIVLFVFPTLLPASFDLIAVLGAALVLGGGGMLLAGLHRHRGHDGDGWDDGSRV